MDKVSKPSTSIPTPIPQLLHTARSLEVTICRGFRPELCNIYQQKRVYSQQSALIAPIRVPVRLHLKEPAKCIADYSMCLRWLKSSKDYPSPFYRKPANQRGSIIYPPPNFRTKESCLGPLGWDRTSKTILHMKSLVSKRTILALEDKPSGDQLRQLTNTWFVEACGRDE